MFDKLMRSVKQVTAHLASGGSEKSDAAKVEQKASGFPRRAVPQNVIRIEYEMMLKGAVYDRGGGKVKQYGVTVDGATKVVTSGQFVDQATYEALVRAGAIRPVQKDGPKTPLGQAPRGQRRAG